MIEINRLESLNPAIRERFLKRVFTENEIQEANGQWHSLAGRFAAKEAVAKALGCGIGPIRWQEIEIQRGQQNEPMLELHGAALRLSVQLGLETWSVSISHTRTHAVAMATALGRTSS